MGRTCSIGEAMAALECAPWNWLFFFTELAEGLGQSGTTTRGRRAVLYRAVTVQRPVVRYVTPCTLVCASVSYLLPPSSGFQAHGGSGYFKKGGTYLGGTCRHGSRDSSVGIRTGQSGDRSPVIARFSTLVQAGHRTHPSSCPMGTGSFPGVQRAGAWRWPPTPSIAEVKERVELYLCSPYVPSWHILGRPLPYIAFYVPSHRSRNVKLQFILLSRDSGCKSFRFEGG